ncbi:glycosyltransferase family 2 protein [Caulobacter sp. Root487D2Y]|uniref:glycosyltransferase family 2 protein n=1 Tax=Caulobacter sp. Root487D2Y TaxID=1736547 RepID=UPI0009EC199D|nr:glycosyltransferase family 2 protein [Caulobacter sp. Root487D2Y]
MASGAPTVSVIIPTRNRADLVCRAVRSVLVQSVSSIEIIVSIDGPDPVTEAALAQIHDPRLRVIVAPESKGAPAARNRGFEAATGEWIALLDDDDEWMPTKLERQLEIAARSSFALPIIASSLIARSPSADYTWPREVPSPAVPISEYMMVRTGLFSGDRVIQTSTVMARRAHFTQVPYLVGLKKHQDWDWLLKALAIEGAGLEFVPEALTVWYIEENRPGITASNDWRASREWALSVRDLITDRAYAAFLLLYVGSMAARTGQRDSLRPILSEALATKAFAWRHIAIYLSLWIIPPSTRQRLRGLVHGRAVT